MARILALRLELTGAGFDGGPRTIAAHLRREGVVVPSVATIWRILTREGLVVPEPRKRPRRSYLRFEADLPNECWQADFTHWPLADGTDTEILCWIDDHSRYVISITAHAPVTGAHVVDTFRTAISVHGMPASTLTDIQTQWCLRACCVWSAAGAGSRSPVPACRCFLTEWSAQRLLAC